ncbi:MAG: hypothetical protein H6506_04430 [Calditrichaeota bacterium]|nr:hypothetical protein [Calditrichota bacterium]MCB9367108.1 hypothetical protein [Calditrichota bacterium]MCB9391880.1 hypothetical protein [Calditrichota bacterium]
MTRILSAFNLLKRVGFAVLVLEKSYKYRQTSLNMRQTMENLSASLRLCILIIASCTMAIFAAAEQVLTRQDAFDRIQIFVNASPSELRTPDSGLPEMIREWQYKSDGEVTTDMIAFFESLADDPMVYPTTRAAAIRALHLSSPELQLARLRRLMQEDNQYASIPSAALMVEWGFWEEGSRVLIEHEAWGSLASTGDSSMVSPILISIADDHSKAGVTRLRAAGALGSYGDTTYKYDVARDILASVVLRNEVCADTGDFLRCVTMIVDMLDRTDNPQDVELLDAALYFPNQGVQSFCLFALGRRARNLDDILSVESLERAASQSAFPELKRRAAEQVAIYNSERGQR